MLPLIVYLFFGIITAWFGRNRAIGFWGFLIVGVMFTPLSAALVLLATSESSINIDKKTTTN